MNEYQKEFAERALRAAMNKESLIESRMASSSKYAIDPVDEIPGLREAMEKITHVDNKTAERLIINFLQSLN